MNNQLKALLKLVKKRTKGTPRLRMFIYALFLLIFLLLIISVVVHETK